MLTVYILSTFISFNIKALYAHAEHNYTTFNNFDIHKQYYIDFYSC